MKSGAMRVLGVACHLFFLAFALDARATVWIEQDDAGDLPVSAQSVTGFGVTEEIRGTIGRGGLDIDLYRIRIGDEGDPGRFSATVAVGSADASSFDLNLFLFDSVGRLVYGIDGTRMNRLPDRSFLSPSAPGEYLLAVSPHDIRPFGPSDEFGFRNSLFVVGSVLIVYGPDGPGANEIVSHWGGGYHGISGTYVVTLTNVSAVPEASRLTLSLFGLGLMMCSRTPRSNSRLDRPTAGATSTGHLT